MIDFLRRFPHFSVGGTAWAVPRSVETSTDASIFALAKAFQNGMAKADFTSGFRFYVPEIHDVYPGMEAQLDAMLDAWPKEARPHIALLVVPNWQNRFPLAEPRRFGDRIAQLPGEKVLHGWTHSLGPDLWNWLLYGHDNRSEFAKLDGADATARIAAGGMAFKEQFGAMPRWFCAPRWQQSAAATEALRQAGFSSYMLHGSLRRFSGERADLPSICFDEGERRLKSAFLRWLRERTISALFAEQRPFRVTLHPDDVKDAATWAQVKRVMARLADEGWTPVGPDEALARFNQENLDGIKVSQPA